jgi:hypothetical protein
MHGREASVIEAQYSIVKPHLLLWTKIFLQTFLEKFFFDSLCDNLNKYICALLVTWSI